jgi:1-acyl-sn-glycerol-3-phosphate acyltransferase
LPVVPIRIDGLYELKKKNKKFSRPGTVVVTVGPALRINREADPMTIAQELEIQMGRLSHEKNC